MNNEVRIINESYPKQISSVSFEGHVEDDKVQVFIQQDGNIVAQGGDVICTSTTLSSAITLKQEIK